MKAIVKMIGTMLLVTMLADMLVSCQSNFVTQLPENEKVAFDILVDNGYSGTAEEWVASLIAETKSGKQVRSAYELAREKGYTGSLEEWVDLLLGSLLADQDPQIRDHTPAQ